MKSDGDCYKIAGDNVIDNHEFILCHGIVAGQGKLKGFWIAHAWNELNDVVFDFSNGAEIVVPKDKYYKIGRITKVKKYSWIEASKLMLKTGNYGAWDKSVALEKPVKIEEVKA